MIGKKNLKIIVIINLLILLTVFSMVSVISIDNLKSLKRADDLSINESNTSELIWNITWGGADYDSAQGLAMDSNNYIYCVGITKSFGAANFDHILVKFHPNGTKIWNQSWGEWAYDGLMDIEIDSNDNIYCAGYQINELNILKFRPNGTLVKNITWGSGSNSEIGIDLTIDLNGNIYSTGHIFSGGKYDFFLVKFDADLNEKWNTTWGGVNDEEAFGVSTDSNGYIYCTGYTGQYSGLRDLALVKFHPNGTQIWNITWGGPFVDEGHSVVVDFNDSIYCTGYSESIADQISDLIIVKFDPDGTELFNLTWRYYNYSKGDKIILSSNGSIYCSGVSMLDSYASDDDLIIVKFFENGTRAWNFTWGEPDYKYEGGNDIILGSDGYIYCAGYTTSYGAGFYDLLLIKLEELWTPESPNLNPIIPNPDSDGAIDLNWSDVRYARIYYIYRETSPISSLNGLTPYITCFNSSYNDIILKNGIYFYAIVAGNIVGNSSISNCENVTITIPIDTPNLQPIRPNISTNGSIELKWDEIIGATKYYIYRDTSNILSIIGLSPISMINNTNYTDTVLANGIYYYAILASDNWVNSTISNCESVAVEIPSSTNNPINGFEMYFIVLVLIIYLIPYYKLRIKNTEKQ